MREADLYAPVKTYLEAQGYQVKAEVGDCDLLACDCGVETHILSGLSNAGRRPPGAV